MFFEQQQVAVSSFSHGADVEVNLVDGSVCNSWIPAIVKEIQDSNFLVSITT